MDDAQREVTAFLANPASYRPDSGPVEIIETPWWKQEWTRGCSMAHFGPGVLTQYGHLLRQPVGRDAGLLLLLDGLRNRFSFGGLLCRA